MWYWFSTEKMTCLIEVDKDAIIIVTPPILSKFVGQPLHNLERWLKQQRGYQCVAGTSSYEDGKEFITWLFDKSES